MFFFYFPRIPPNTRRDVWRKHYASCPQNNNHDEPPPARRGKQAKACDACFRSKLACGGNAPCGRCSSRGAACTYTRLQHELHDKTPSLSPDTASVIGSQAPALSSPSSPSSPLTKEAAAKTPISFLLSLTNPKAESLLDVFFTEPQPDDDNDDPSTELQPELLNPTDQYSQPFTAADTMFLPWLLDHDLFPEPSVIPSEDTLGQLPNTPEEEIDPPLKPLLTSIQSTYNHPRLPSPSQIFTTPNRILFIRSYFQHTHPHMPLIHRGSLDAEEGGSTPVLVLAVALAGALYAPPRDCVIAGRAWYKAVEEWVFERLGGLVEDFRWSSVSMGSSIPGMGKGGRNLEGKRTGKEDDDSKAQRALEKETYETLQAAILITGAQFLMNNPAFRSKHWTMRRPMLVEAVRKLGLMGARHTQDVNEHRELDWERWVWEETRVRLATWTFLGDWQQAGVFHVPGCSAIYEMTGDMPSLPALWDAKLADEFHRAVIHIRTQQPGCWKRTASLRTCMDALLGENWKGVGGFPLKGLSLLDLHILISTLHTQIATAHHSLLLPLPSIIPLLRRATLRWQVLWETTLGPLTADEVRASGFVRHGGEYCWLARGLLSRAERYVRGSEKGKVRGMVGEGYFERLGHETPRELHEMLRGLRGEGNLTRE
ncbi:zinc finger protein zas1 [Dichotomopilus funicola]|uniref:Zinc finger protein zas1 n=1 Tax=Dichotomopilus funicola TaxID=1934379 RepID=A0AAN6UZL5_9PEZI|nr:zinc finger protein zas1 [Dichotomopilus funicola]